jgi:hypothetical protein
MTTEEVDVRMALLERTWFAEHRAATEARTQIGGAERSNQIEVVEAARARLMLAELRKTEIMREIEALEANLLD